jgi:hypothetical protein
MGFGKTGKWNIGNIPLENVVKSMHKKINAFKKVNPAKDGIFDFPLFHYSICEAKSPTLNKYT